MTEPFLCERLHVRLSVPACGARWAGAQDPLGPPELTRSACKGCPVGEGNAAIAGPQTARSRVGRGQPRAKTATVCGVEVRVLPGEERRGTASAWDVPSNDPAWRERSVPLLAFLSAPRQHEDLLAWARATRHGQMHLQDLLAWCHTEGLVEGSAREGWRRSGTAAVPAPAAPRAPGEDRDMTSPEKEEEETMAGPKDAAMKLCAKCGKDYRPTGNRQKYCADCGPPSRAKSAAPRRAAKPAPAPDTRLALIRDRATAARRAEPAPAASPVALTSLDAVADAAAVRQIRAHRERVLAAFDLVLATMGPPEA